MIKHTADVTVAALTQWMLTNQDDTGCREAANQLGELGAVSTLMEMLDGPLTARCALEVAAALGNYADATHLFHLYRHRAEYGRIAAVLDFAIEQNDGECTCGQGHDTYGDASGPDGAEPPVPPFSRN